MTYVLLQSSLKVLFLKSAVKKTYPPADGAALRFFCEFFDTEEDTAVTEESKDRGRELRQATSAKCLEFTGTKGDCILFFELFRESDL